MDHFHYSNLNVIIFLARFTIEHYDCFFPSSSIITHIELFYFLFSETQHEHPGFYLKGTCNLYIHAFSIIYLLLKKEKTCSFVMGMGGKGGAYLTDVGREANRK